MENVQAGSEGSDQGNDDLFLISTYVNNYGREYNPTIFHTGFYSYRVLVAYAIIHILENNINGNIRIIKTPGGKRLIVDEKSIEKASQGPDETQS